MLHLFNSLTRRIEPVVPLEPGVVRIYSCGPTVYRYIHIGNLRTFVLADWLRRALLAGGLAVRHVKNITDVGHMRQELLDRGEDKLIAQARKEGKSSAAIAAFYTEAFFADEAALNILPAHVFPRATEHISEMITIIKGLEAKGLAYQAGGNVYFAVSRFPAYGRLSGNLLEHLLEGVREAADPHKRNQEDFALWKAAEPGREMAWDSPWGRGFPGWHIECSAMSMRYLGPRFDIHTGGVDNLFPHHEDEIAQSEGFTGQQFVTTWVHAQHLLADGMKMAKSTGNAYTRADIAARGFEPLALRYLYATAHYRARINFTFTALRAAQRGLARLRAACAELGREREERPLAPEERAALDGWRTAFFAAVYDDLNMPRALAVVWSVVRGPQAAQVSPAARRQLVLEFDEVLGLGIGDWGLGIGQRGEVPIEVVALVRQREELRAQQAYVEADRLRDEIADQGFVVRDTREGPLVLPRQLNDDLPMVSSPRGVPDRSGELDLYDFSVNLLAHNSRADLQRCVESIVRHSAGRAIEIVIIDNGSTDDTLSYLRDLLRDGLPPAADGRALGLEVIFADHNMGFGAGRNATLRASRGRVIVLLDTSIELKGDIWHLLDAALADQEVGLVGPYGLVTDDLCEFVESDGPDVDGIEGYLMAWRRAALPEFGWLNERFRFYRLLDLFYSFTVKSAGYLVRALPALAALLEKHPHREWYSLSEEEQRTKSKKNYDLFRARWHHGESLLAANYCPERRWFGHDHPRHIAGDHTHPPDELPPPGQPHSHTHQHWPDHAHDHPHYHR